MSKKREGLPVAIRQAVWNLNVGPEINKTKCFVGCGVDIQMQNFECGHIVSHANDGSNKIDNLLPICGKCNKSMGTTSITDFQNKYGLVLKKTNDTLKHNVIEQKNKTQNDIEHQLTEIRKNLALLELSNDKMEIQKHLALMELSNDRIKIETKKIKLYLSAFALENEKLK